LGADEKFFPWIKSFSWKLSFAVQKDSLLTIRPENKGIMHSAAGGLQVGIAIAKGGRSQYVVGWTKAIKIQPK